VPKPGPEYEIRFKIRGKTAYMMAERGEDSHVVMEWRAGKMPGMMERQVRLSPDNRTLTFTTWLDPPSLRMGIWTVGVDGKNRRLLADVADEFWVVEPIWSPDSKRLAYVRTQSPGEAPRLEVWVVNADGTGHRRLFAHRSFDTDIFYSSDPHPMYWTSRGDIEYKDYKRGVIWTANGRTGRVSYRPARLTPPNAGIPLIRTARPIVPLSQNDPRWRYDNMESCDYSVGGYGCAVTATTMAFSGFGVGTTPDELAEELDENACPIYWALAARLMAKNKLDLQGMYGFDYGMLDLALKQGRPAIVHVTDRKARRNQILNHWVLVVGGGGQEPEGYRIYDPWDGSTYKTLDYYISKGYRANRVLVFEPWKPDPPEPKPVVKPQPPKVKPAAPAKPAPKAAPAP
jgi:hypothetical protein